MYIQIAPTDDPETLRFLPGGEVHPAGGRHFADAAAAGEAPLARSLLAHDDIAAVAYGPDFVAVTKVPDADWLLLKPRVLGTIMDHLLAGTPYLVERAVDHDPEDGEIVVEIEDVLDARVRPVLARIDASLAVLAFRDGEAVLEVDGLLQGTPLFSLEVRIENTLRHYVPEVMRVRLQAHGVATETPDLDLDDPETAAVFQAIDERINPAVAGHGGHIALIDVRDHTAYIRLEGGCQGCGLADVTLKQGVETTIREAVPSIVAVLDTTDHAGGENPYYQPGKSGASPL